MSSQSENTNCGHEAALLLPWFVTGRLPAGQEALVRAHLRQCTACAADERRERRLQALIAGEPAVEPAPQPGLQQLFARIDAQAPAPGGGRESFRAGGGARPAYLRWLAAAVVVQAIGLGVLGTLLWERMQAPRFSTLSAPAPQPGPGVHVRVVFAPTATLEQMRALLVSLPAEVVAGPSAAGVYTLSVLDGQAAALRRLRASEAVAFAEPLPGEESVP
jgi:hypothetical protein